MTHREKVSRIALISCVKTKANRALPAKDLYISPWFTKARSLVERSGLTWFILSAEHGLVEPHAIIQPYERTLNKMSAADRMVWSERVISQIENMVPEAGEVVVLAGERYRENLMPYLRGRYRAVTVPMKGLTSGRQLNWLDNAATL